MNDTFSKISSKAIIGQNVKIGMFCIIEDDVIIMDDVVIDNHVMIFSGARIGHKTKIGHFSMIGKNVLIGDNCMFTGYCEIRDDCEIGNEVNMGSRGTLSAGTIVEDNVTMKYSFVATDIPVLKEKDKKRPCILKRGSRFGANVTILPSIIIGSNSEIGACSQVRKNVPDNEIWYGNPAKFYKKA
jgi:acetyltransferase-like isoleucine patch superfamily enzyme